MPLLISADGLAALQPKALCGVQNNGLHYAFYAKRYKLKALLEKI